MIGWLGRKVPVLAHPQYRLLFFGTTLAQLAFGMMVVVQGVVAFELTGKNSAVGLVSLGMGVSMLIIGPIGGSLSDRLSKRRLLLFTQCGMGITFGAVGALIVTDLISIWLLALSSFVLGAMFAVMGPTRQAWVGDLLEGPLLSSGIALQQLMINATRIIGPLLAGAMFAVEIIGGGGTYLSMAAIFVVVVVLLRYMEPTPPNPDAAGVSLFENIREGAVYVWREPQLRLLTGTFVGIVLTGFSYQTLMPGMLENELGESAKQVGLMFGAAAGGGIITTLVLTARQSDAPTAGLMTIFGLVLAAGLVMLAAAPNLLFAMGFAAIVGAASSGFQLLNNVNLMQKSRPEYFGRVMSLTMMAFGVNSLCAFPIGAFADMTGERMTLALLGVGCLGVVLGGWSAGRGGPRAAVRLPRRRVATADSLPEAID